MIDPVKTVVSSPSTTADRRGGGDSPAAPAADVPPKAATPPQAATTDQPLRLVVEPTENGASYTYKLFDRATGELVMELPLERAAKLSESPDYTAGQVINAKA